MKSNVYKIILGIVSVAITLLLAQLVMPMESRLSTAEDKINNHETRIAVQEDRWERIEKNTDRILQKLDSIESRNKE